MVGLMVVLKDASKGLLWGKKKVFGRAAQLVGYLESQRVGLMEPSLAASKVGMLVLRKAAR